MAQPQSAAELLADLKLHGCTVQTHGYRSPANRKSLRVLGITPSQAKDRSKSASAPSHGRGYNGPELTR